MIDLDKLIQRILVACVAGGLVLITHLLTVEMMFNNFESLNAEIHEQTIEASQFPLPRLNSPDSLAYCINMVEQMKEDFR
jgi:small neutral amino acid transporter SnatA (MarC family)